MKEPIKELAAFALLIAVSVFMLFQFSLIGIYGDVTFYEPNKIILTIEIILCLGVLVLGIERIRSFIRKFK